MKRVYFILISLALFASCNEELSSDQVIDNELIINYIAQNNIEAFHYTNGLFYSITDENNNTDFPSTNSTVEVKYKGFLLNGTVVDSSDNEFIKICLTECIEGWQLGIPLFTKNSKGMLFVPSHLAYGEFRTSNIPPHSVIIYEIELKSFRN